jgi:uncharacterized protein (TIGR00730 family)
MSCVSTRPLARTASTLTSVCVYCGSSNSASAAHLELARQFGASLARRGLRMVYGGGRVGLMGAAAMTCHASGGQVLGVMPKFLANREILYEEIETHIVATMHERKWRMFEESDAFAVLPGGIGTLEEVVEMLSWRRLDLHVKPIALLANDGFWRPFVDLIEHTIAAGLTPPWVRDGYFLAATPDEAIAGMIARLARNGAPPAPVAT